MWWIVLVLLLVLAMGGFGHTGYRRGWYGNYNRGEDPLGGWGGLRLSVFLLVIVAVMLLTRNYHLGVTEP